MANKTMNIGNTSNNVDVKITGTINTTGDATFNSTTYLKGSVYADYVTTLPDEMNTEQVFWVSGANGSELTYADGLKWLPINNVIQYEGSIVAAEFTGPLTGNVNGNATTADKVNKSLTIGSQVYDGSATVTISAADLGLSNALHFRGTTTVTNPAGTYSNGDVVLNTSTKKEYIYNDGAWIELGDESSYVLKETGKGLSTNDYTTEEKTKLAGLSNYTLPTATSSTLGGVKIGSTLTISNGVLSLPTASATVLGGVKIGSTLTINSGIVDVKPATSSTLGGIKAGNNITIASDGTLSIGGYLPLSGGTITGDITSTTGKGLKVSGSGDVLAVTATSNSNTVALKAGADATGLWDVDAGKWIIYSQNSEAHTEMALYGAGWNDYAEFRRCYDGEAGRCVVENGDDTMSLSTKRLQYGGIISDTFGFVIGDKDNGKPIAVSGRVLAYTDKDRKNFKPGDAVCSGPHGTVSKMTRKEIKEYPEKILGVVSAVPTYEFWGPKQIPVDGRVWIKVR